MKNQPIPKDLKEQLNFTELEQQVINACKQMINDGNDLIYVGDIDNLSNASTKQLRGAMASLVKKGVIDVNNEDGGIITLFSEYR